MSSTHTLDNVSLSNQLDVSEHYRLNIELQLLRKSTEDSIAVVENEVPLTPVEEPSEYMIRRREGSHVAPAIESPGDSPRYDSRALMYGSEKDHSSFPDGGTQANLVLLGSFIGLIADFGIANSLGAIESYVSSHQLKDISKSQVGWVFSLHLGCMYWFGVFFGEFFDKFGAKRPLIAGNFFMCLGLLCTAESRSLYQFILSFSIVTAIGTSLAMSPLIGVLSHWFLKKRAIACSVATIGGLVGSSCFTIMLQQLYGAIGFKNAIRILACICFLLMAVSTILVKERKVANESEGLEEKLSIVTRAVQFFQGALDFSALKDMKFVSLCFAIFLSEVISMTTLTYLASYALTYNIDETKSYLMLTLVNVCGIPSRLLSGLLADKYGRFNVMCLSATLTTVFIFGLWYPANNMALLFAFSILFGISSSAVISLIPACTGQICSAERFGKVYGTLYFFLGFLTILGMYLATLVIAEGTQESYSHFVLFEGALSALSIVVWIWARFSAVGWKWCKF